MRALSKSKNLKQILKRHEFFGHDNETNGGISDEYESLTVEKGEKK